MLVCGGTDSGIDGPSAVERWVLQAGLRVRVTDEGATDKEGNDDESLQDMSGDAKRLSFNGGDPDAGEDRFATADEESPEGHDVRQEEEEGHEEELCGINFDRNVEGEVEHDDIEHYGGGHECTEGAGTAE